MVLTPFELPPASRAGRSWFSQSLESYDSVARFWRWSMVHRRSPRHELVTGWICHSLSGAQPYSGHQ